MADKPCVKLYSMTIDCLDPLKLANFYAALLGWVVPYYDEDYASVGAPDTVQGGYPCIVFQRNPEYRPPVWPEQPEAQQQMEHLDFAVDDLDGAVRHAVACGAAICSQQFDEHWRVMFDPSGHPFCLCDMGHVIHSEGFKLL